MTNKWFDGNRVLLVASACKALEAAGFLRVAGTPSEFVSDQKPIEHKLGSLRTKLNWDTYSPGLLLSAGDPDHHWYSVSTWKAARNGGPLETEPDDLEADVSYAIEKKEDLLASISPARRRETVMALAWTHEDWVKRFVERLHTLPREPKS